ncbi:hypothetical protein HSBAA_PA_3210 (plasmid) [Vreelandella sulfidaeris]|uniref:Uncharacterized protein n=1 Tax=Vreelandella sulfidaeris TaxID=115553 RepID=A0A455UN30_9GAMM|nr:hypothetical protein HSBAA_PA_3210 [Halomonas sulfidaeris]
MGAAGIAHERFLLGVSIPSAMVFMPQWLAMKTMVLTSEAFSEEAFGPDTNDLSILTVSRG